MQNQEVAQIRDFIMYGDLDSAFKILMGMQVDSIIHDEVRSLSANYYKANKDFNTGATNMKKKEEFIAELFKVY